MTLNDLYIPISEVNSYNQNRIPNLGDPVDIIDRGARDERID